MAKRRGTETTRDMLLSLGVVLLLVGLVAFFVGTVRGTGEPVSDVDYLAAVNGVPADTSFPPVVPVDLPKDWVSTSARFVGGPVSTWKVGFVTPAETFVGLEQSDDQMDRVVATRLDDFDRAGSVVVSGQRWERYRQQDGGDVAMAQTGPGGSVVLLVGSDGYGDVETVAAALEPVLPDEEPAQKAKSDRSAAKKSGPNDSDA